jgi:hypothetical protein
MAGRGPAPKDPRRRARHDSTPSTTLQFVRAEQPELPESVPWCERTREWWAMWGESPQAEHFMASDWDFLLDTALMHQAVWADGEYKYAAEVRLRVAKFGSTPEDRARLRMHFADADEKDAKRRPAATSAREQFRSLRAVDAS